MSVVYIRVTKLYLHWRRCTKPIIGATYVEYRAIKLYLEVQGDFYQSIRLFHHFLVLQWLSIYGYHQRSILQSIQHLTFLELLKLKWSNGISSLPEWLGDLSSLKSLVISGCEGIKSLPPCTNLLTKLQKLQIEGNLELMKWCESEFRRQQNAPCSHKNLSKFTVQLHSI